MNVPEDINDLDDCPYCDGRGFHEGQGVIVDLLAGKVPDGAGYMPPQAGNTVCGHCQGTGMIHPKDLKQLIDSAVYGTDDEPF